MKLLVLSLMTTATLYGQDFSPNKKQDFEDNYSCHSDRCISYQYLDNRNPPTVKTANAFITAVIYPVELMRCDWAADKVYAITAIFPDGSAQELEPKKKAKYPFKKIKITVKPDLSQKNSSSHDNKSINLYRIPRTNLQCDDVKAVIYDVMVVTNTRPHQQVTLAFKSKNKNKSNIIKMIDRRKSQNAVTSPQGKKNVPKRVKYKKRHKGNLSKDEMTDFIERHQNGI